MDLNQKGSESAEMMNITSPASEVAMQKKSCSDCQTTKTPLWRSGPAGPRSLCNACGIRNRKQRRALLGLSKVGSGSEKTKMKKTKKQSITSHSNSSSSSSSNEMGASVNVEVAELGIDMSFQRSWGNKKKKTQLREEEEAAMLLMALSCGSVFA